MERRTDSPVSGNSQVYRDGNSEAVTGKAVYETWGSFKFQQGRNMITLIEEIDSTSGSYAFSSITDIFLRLTPHVTVQADLESSHATGGLWEDIVSSENVK